MTSPSAAARPTVFFHVGAPKTGTTYLQHVMDANRDRLRRDGVLYPGPQVLHFHASQDLRGAAFHDFDDPHIPGAWQRLVSQVRSISAGASPRRAIISHESFETATRPQIAQACDDLSFAEVHLVYTARDLARQLPAVWQERVKNRSVQTWAEFLAAVQSGRRSGGGLKQFWRIHDIARVLRRWSETIPADRVHVVTVPPAGSARELLWHRLAGLLGVDPTGYDTDAPKGGNASLGAAEAAVLRRFNEAIAALDVPWPAYAAVFKQQVAPTLGQRSARIELPEDVYDWTIDWSKRTVDELAAAGYDVVGDLDELIPRHRPTGLDPDNVPGELFGEAAVAGMVSLLELVLESPRAAGAVRRARRGAVARRLEGLAHRSPAVAAIRDAYRRWR